MRRVGRRHVGDVAGRGRREVGGCCIHETLCLTIVLYLLLWTAERVVIHVLEIQI